MSGAIGHRLFNGCVIEHRPFNGRMAIADAIGSMGGPNQMIVSLYPSDRSIAVTNQGDWEMRSQICYSKDIAIVTDRAFRSGMRSSTEIG